ncbi:hypothetical protein AX16_002431 [Volvariella volvacea WC 439]|nr:hypothetical protein AX16_002431 [Volvariella volvacea WC 439]
MALAGLKVIEFAGLAPGPFAGLVLADNGASVIRIDRPGSTSTDVLCRGKRSIAVDSKVPQGNKLLRQLITSADVVIDPFRPGVMERMGLGPEVFLGNGEQKGLNERLIYARMIGFPRQGPYENMAGHDVNYIALSGVLSLLPGSQEKPTFPLNILADFAGGGLMCAMGILLALIDRGRTGRGQVVDANMVSGARYVSAFPLLQASLPGLFSLGASRGDNLLDGGAPFYNVYTCQDGRWMTVGCLEPQFYAAFLKHFLPALPRNMLGGWKPTKDTQFNRDEWPKLKAFIEAGFRTNTRDYWQKVFLGTDACVAPVLTPEEARTAVGGDSSFPLPHPVVSNWAVPKMLHPIVAVGQHTDEILKELGIGGVLRRTLIAEGAVEGDGVSSKL